jgi:LEA14-like dessication related protein
MFTEEIQLNDTCRLARRRLLQRLVVGGVLAAAALVAACSSLPRALAPPAVELTGLSLLRATSDRQDFRVTLRIANPNPIPIPVEDLRFNIRLGGEGLLAGGTSSRMTLPARGEETLRLEVSTDLVSSIRRLLSLAQGPDDALSYELDGYIALDRRHRRTLPFRTRGEVPLTATMAVQ